MRHHLPSAIATLLIVSVIVAGAIAYERDSRAAQGSCTIRVDAGRDVAEVVANAPTGSTICLGEGEYPAFVIHAARQGITIRGEGPALTQVRAGERDGIAITYSTDMTLKGLTVRGGDPTGVFATHSPGLTLENVLIEQAAVGLHVEEETSTTLTKVTVRQSRQFGLLVRKSASISASDLRVLDHTGIGVGVVDEPGEFSMDTGEVRRAEGDVAGENFVLIGTERFSLRDVLVRGGDPAGIYAARTDELVLENVWIDNNVFGLHLDDRARAEADNLLISNSTGVALLAQRGGSIDGQGVRVLDAQGTGISLINNAGELTLRDSEVRRIRDAGLFAGIVGCRGLPPVSLEVPACYYDDLRAYLSTTRVSLENVEVEETGGPCLVFYPGVRADLAGGALRRCELTGLFAWGATANVSGTHFDDNAEHAIEYRAYPDPRREVVSPAAGTLEDVVVTGTRPLPGAIVGAAGAGSLAGGGILGQRAEVNVRRSEVRGNADTGIAYANGATGVIDDVMIVENGGAGLCLLRDVDVAVLDAVIEGNRNDAVTACGGSPR